MLIGNVGADPEVRYLESSVKDNSRVASLRLATTERYRDRNNEVKEVTEWHSLVAWGQNAVFIEKYVKKGAMLYIEGSLRSRSWDGRDGQKHYVTEIRVETVQLLSRRDAADVREGSAARAPLAEQLAAGGAAVKGQASAGFSAAPADDDDLPF